MIIVFPGRHSWQTGTKQGSKSYDPEDVEHESESEPAGGSRVRVRNKIDHHWSSSEVEQAHHVFDNPMVTFHLCDQSSLDG